MFLILFLFAKTNFASSEVFLKPTSINEYHFEEFDVEKIIDDEGESDSSLI